MSICRKERWKKLELLEEQFSENRFRFRPNRSAEQAVIKPLKLLNDGNDWIVDIDLEKFLDTVN